MLDREKCLLVQWPISGVGEPAGGTIFKDGPFIYFCQITVDSNCRNVLARFDFFIFLFRKPTKKPHHNISFFMSFFFFFLNWTKLKEWKCGPLVQLLIEKINSSGRNPGSRSSDSHPLVNQNWLHIWTGVQNVAWTFWTVLWPPFSVKHTTCSSPDGV